MYHLPLEIIPELLFDLFDSQLLLLVLDLLLGGGVSLFLKFKGVF